MQLYPCEMMQPRNKAGTAGWGTRPDGEGALYKKQDELGWRTIWIGGVREWKELG